MRFFLPFIGLIAAIWVYYDSQKRGYSVGRGLLWAVGVFLGLIVFLPLYFISRSRKGRLSPQASRTEDSSSVNSCFYCRQSYEGHPRFCPHCGQDLTMQK